MSRDLNRYNPIFTDSLTVGSGGVKEGHAVVLTNGLAVLAGANVKPFGIAAETVPEGGSVEITRVGFVPAFVNADSANLDVGDRLTTAANGVFVKTGAASGQISSATTDSAADADGVFVSVWINAVEVPFIQPA